MKWRLRVPRESAGVALLADMARELSNSIQTLSEMLGSESAEFPRLLERLHGQEGQSNELFFRLMTTMRSSIVNRLPREDLYRLGEDLNNAIESVVATADLIVGLDVAPQSPRTAELLEIVQRMSDNSLKIFARFENLDDLEDIWVDNLRLAKRAEHTRLAWLREVMDRGTSSSFTKHTLTSQRITQVITDLRRLSMRVGEIIVRES
jgi:uncharacterized protein Yka (UPF0111/DUF47 family)